MPRCGAAAPGEEVARDLWNEAVAESAEPRGECRDAWVRLSTICYEAGVPVVSVRGLTKAYGPQALFEDASFTIRRGERVGLLGANGTGKSTLLRVLAGLEPADRGTLELRRGASVMFLAQEPTLDPASTPRMIAERGMSAWQDAMRSYTEISAAIGAGARDAALLERHAQLADTIERLGGWAREHLALEMLGLLGVGDVDRPVGTMSGGERRRVALSEVLVARPDLAILDEPTNHLDIEVIEWLEAHLCDEFSGAVLIVTHDRYVLDAVADRVLELEARRIQEYQGGYAEYLLQKAELLAQSQRVEQNRLNLLRRERAWLLRGAQARTTKQKARRQRAEALLAAEAPAQARAVEFGGLEAGGGRLGKTILDLDGVDLELGGRRLIRNLSMRLVAGERVGIVGPNGAGKTSLLRLCSGELPVTGGRVVRGTNTRLVHFDQSRSALKDDWSIVDNVAEREGADRSGAGTIRIGEKTLEMRAYLELFLFEGDKQRQKVGALSGGERARVALAKALRSGANLLLLDEPTNDLDVSTLGALEELLEAWPGCALIVSHDRYFLDRVATSMLAFEGDGRVLQYPGNYASYVSLQKQRVERDRALTAESAAVARPRAADPIAVDPAEPRALSYAERKELDGILEQITALESRVAELGARLADAGLYAGPGDEVKNVQQALRRAEQELSARTARWEELELRRDVKRR